ncbi:MAG: flippase-like domain-containing protein [Candidatus Eremiobacteraeota bacterium]|nr:flippase-like domain-containing protein [Candidatus Eremiobacteraeota bacterium]MCW5872211.1 flippase-like domain-containing protein [Candidatus Eremiobacteraeota bacterium]
MLIGGALLVGLWSRFSWNQVALAFHQVGWAMVPLVLLAAVWLPWDTLTLSRLLRPGALSWRLLWLEWSCDSLCTLIPLAGLGGEPFRYRHLPGYTERPLQVLVAYRSLHAWAGLFTAWAGAALCWLTGQPGLPWGGLALAGLAVWIGGLVAFTRAHARYWSELPGRRLLQAFAAKLVSRTLQISEVGCVLLALGVPLTPAGWLLIQSSLMAAASLFSFIPGGLGVHETALLSACQALGLSPEIGFQLGLIRRCRQLAWSLLGLLPALCLEAGKRRFGGESQPS